MSYIPSQSASNSAIQGSRARRSGGPILLDFSHGWGRGAIFEWYKGIRSTAVALIQLRKEFEEPFRHEFILVVLQGGGLCRLDRRGDPHVPTQTLSSSGSEAHDTVHELSSLGTVESTSECLVELRPNGTIDLAFILSICFSIRSDQKTQRYTLQRFNCYFFSWTITSVVARHSVAWETPAQFSAGQLASTLKTKAVGPIAKKVAEMATNAVSAVFICAIRPRVREVLRKHLRPAGFFPTVALNLLFSLWMRRNMKPHMEAVMRGVIESAMTTTLESTVESMLDSRSSVIRTALSSTLWFDWIRETLKKTARTVLRDAVWALMVKMLKAANGAGIPVEQPYAQPTSNPTITLPTTNPSLQTNISSTTNPFKPSENSLRKRRVGGLLDKTFVTGMSAVADNSYHGGILSAWGMSEGLTGDTQTREEWNQGWTSLWATAFEHAHQEGQAVVNDVAHTEPPDAARDEIWVVVWEELKVGFELSSQVVRDHMWDSFECATATVVDVVTDAVFAALQEHRQCNIEAALNSTPVSSDHSIVHVPVTDWSLTSRPRENSGTVLI